MDYKAFIEARRALLVAPAGYGKTYTIAKCLKFTEGRQLILTHTHAGVSSLKRKFKSLEIPSKNFTIETISSFAQKYANAFHYGNGLPDPQSKNYHSILLEKALLAIQTKLVGTVIVSTYKGLFVDEYQDCSLAQHAIINTLSIYLPTRILGDPLQGIFDFNNAIISFENDLTAYSKFPELNVPQRWYSNGNNAALGDAIKIYRQTLLKPAPLKLEHSPEKQLYVYDIKETDIDDNESRYRKYLKGLISNPQKSPELESLLIIVPEYSTIKNGKAIRKGTISDRAKLASKIDPSNSMVLLEAIDDSSYYSTAKEADKIIDGLDRAHKPIKNVYSFLARIFKKTSPKARPNVGLDDWFSKSKEGDYRIKKKNGASKNSSYELDSLVNDLMGSASANKLRDIILYLRVTMKIRLNRRFDQFHAINKALTISVEESISVHEAMLQYKNRIRQSGRKIEGKCIGTTLLTKGLEFDTVVILDAHRFTCPKNLYVALTRCCKKLVIFTSSFTLLKKSTHKET